MSQENVDLVQSVLEAHDRGDFATVFAAYDPAIEWHVGRLGLPGAFVEPVYKGHEGVRAFWARVAGCLETVSFEYEEFIDAGERVVASLTQRMRGRTSGVELEWASYAGIWTVPHGRIVKVELFPGRSDALEAAGLSE